MSESSESTSFQNEYDPDDPAKGYRPISGMAIIALALALLGLLSTVFPVLVFLCVLAAVFAVMAIVKIDSDSSQVGMKVAQTALFLAVFTATFSLGYSFGRTAYLNHYAKKHAITILDTIVQGRYAGAFEYSISPELRQPEGTDLETFYMNSKFSRPNQPPPIAQIAKWKSDPPLSIYIADQGKGKFRYLRFDKLRQLQHTWEPFVCVFKYEPEDRMLASSTFQVIMLRRIYQTSLGVQWRCSQFRILEGPTADPAVETKIGPGPGAGETRKAKKRGAPQGN